MVEKPYSCSLVDFADITRCLELLQRGDCRHGFLLEKVLSFICRAVYFVIFLSWFWTTSFYRADFLMSLLIQYSTASVNNSVTTLIIVRRGTSDGGSTRFQLFVCSVSEFAGLPLMHGSRIVTVTAELRCWRLVPLPCGFDTIGNVGGRVSSNFWRVI